MYNIWNMCYNGGNIKVRDLQKSECIPERSIHDRRLGTRDRDPGKHTAYGTALRCSPAFPPPGPRKKWGPKSIFIFPALGGRNARKIAGKTHMVWAHLTQRGDPRAYFFILTPPPLLLYSSEFCAKLTKTIDFRFSGGGRTVPPPPVTGRF